MPIPHPQAIATRDKNSAVPNMEMPNLYVGIGATWNKRRLIRNAHGQSLRHGVLIDRIYDIGRLEAVLVEQTAPMGILITNGEFVSFQVVTRR